MPRILFAWLGNTDLRAAKGDPGVGNGPIRQAIVSRKPDLLALLSSHSTQSNNAYVRWITSVESTEVQLIKATLPTPMDFSGIYRCAVQSIRDVLEQKGSGSDLIFHLSPGTPAMAAVWILLAKTRFPAELIQSSTEGIVQTASVPFEISADFIPDLLRRPDEELERLSQGLPPEAPEFDAIVHRCALMKRLVARARRVAPRSAPVLIQGETGTGKELVARAIHRASPRRDGPFVAVNCGAIPSELVDSEFFGHEKGAFTGAHSRRIGHIEQAHGGTLFLDEIGELPLHAQVRLLRALQEREVQRVGSAKPQPVDLRVIAATNRDLLQEVVAGRFRNDLYHRLAVAVLRVPPLREREGDLGLLIDRLLEKVNEEAANQPGFIQKRLSPAARTLLLKHPWPGNVRELLNALQSAAIWSSGDRIEPLDVREALLQMSPETGESILGRPLGKGLRLPDLLTDVARHYLQRALEEAHGNKTEAARLVGLAGHQTFTNWVKRHLGKSPSSKRSGGGRSREP